MINNYNYNNDKNSFSVKSPTTITINNNNNNNLEPSMYAVYVFVSYIILRLICSF